MSLTVQPAPAGSASSLLASSLASATPLAVPTRSEPSPRTPNAGARRGVFVTCPQLVRCAAACASVRNRAARIAHITDRCPERPVCDPAAIMRRAVTAINDRRLTNLAKRAPAAASPFWLQDARPRQNTDQSSPTMRPVPSRPRTAFLAPTVAANARSMAPVSGCRLRENVSHRRKRRLDGCRCNFFLRRSDRGLYGEPWVRSGWP